MSRTAQGLAPDLFSLPPSARNTDPDTSHIAASRDKAFRNKDRVAALRAIGAAPDGLTDYELAAKIDRQQNSAGKRRGELRDYGYVEATKDRRPSPTGSPTIV